jgi:hypothetical protein
MTTLLGRTGTPNQAYATASFLNGRVSRRPGTSPDADVGDQSPEPVLPIACAAVRPNDSAGSTRFNCRMRARPS